MVWTPKDEAERRTVEAILAVLREIREARSAGVRPKDLQTKFNELDQLLITLGHRHRPKDRFDGKEPWCLDCGLTSNFTDPDDN